ncbi:hypothetical protein CR513_26936, partial [Mucuna pruriens]
MQDPHSSLQAFQAQLYISGGDDSLNCKLLPGTLKDVAMQQFSSLPFKAICTFSDLAMLLTSQIATNRVKRLEVADLFDIKQMKGENLKKYLAHFNSATFHVNDSDQKRANLGDEDYKPQVELSQFIPLRVKWAQILRELYHTCMLEFPTLTNCKFGSSRNEWCEFHHAREHTTEDCRTLKAQIEKMIREGNLDYFVQS